MAVSGKGEFNRGWAYTERSGRPYCGSLPLVKRSNAAAGYVVWDDWFFDAGVIVVPPGQASSFLLLFDY